MSKNKLVDYVQLEIAAARAVYDDFTGLAAQGVKYLPRILAILAAVVIIVVLLPVLSIMSLFTGDSTTLSGTFSEIAIESLQYKDDWYQEYGLKVYFPIAKEYTVSFSDDFGAGRTHDGEGLFL